MREYKRGLKGLQKSPKALNDTFHYDWHLYHLAQHIIMQTQKSVEEMRAKDNFQPRTCC